MVRNLTVVSIATIAFALLLTACNRGVPTIGGESPSATPSAKRVISVTTVKRGTLGSTLTYSGNVKAKQQVSLVPKVAGRVMKISVDVGSSVKAGDILVELDKDALAAQTAQAEAAVAAAQAKLDALEAGPRAAQVQQAAANLDVARLKLDALKQGGRAEQVAQAEANLRSAQAALDQLQAGPTPDQIAAAEAQVRLAKNQLYLAQSQADAALGSRLPTTFTPDQKEAAAGVAYEQIRIAEAQLAQLKAGPTAAQLAQAQAAVDAAQQQLALAKQPASADDIAQAEAGVRAAEAQLELVRQPATKQDIQAAQAAVAQAQAAFDLAKVQLAEAAMRAPFDGVVSQRMVDEGAMAGPTAPILTLISKDVEVIIDVDEAHLAQITPGMAAKVASSAIPGKPIDATVASVAPSLDAKSRTGQVRLDLPNGQDKLLDGMFVQVTLEQSQNESRALTIPRSAVLESGNETVVFVVKDGMVERRVVMLGGSAGDEVAITNGLNEGEQVAVTSIADLKDGDEVAIQ